ncbi:annulin-like [Haliotis rufescens]|uniref:annulin-like n=1 Tax=Haliotis rufescens TaxID=6454 RepID=UPI00201F43A6|nr:annulin-like [Haliotis rufescens]XP_048253550.1 annulin-like [Haliotis rufescens]
MGNSAGVKGSPASVTKESDDSLAEATHESFSRNSFTSPEVSIDPDMCRGPSADWSIHDRFTRRFPWYTCERAWPPAWDRDAEFGYSSDHHRIGLLFEEETMMEVDPLLLEERLHVTGVNLHIKENTEAHHTNMYQCTGDQRRHPARMKPELVIRRGQEFLMTVLFDRPCDPKQSDLTLTFNLGEDYKPHTKLSSTMKVKVGANASYSRTKWGATCVGQDATSLTLAIFVPAHTPVGEWEFSITAVVEAKEDCEVIWQYTHNEDVAIIFNPWCREDVVYLDDEDWRKEAVLNDSGPQYSGSVSRMAASSWFYGQFEDGILEVALHLVRRAFGFEATPAMGSAARVVKALTQIVNAPDDDGVLMGNWSGEYEGGTRPTKWNGSVKILRQYMDTAKPVKYGQCWVFAGVLITVCRALGIPCRGVTSYNTAHNMDMTSLAVDYVQMKNESGYWCEISDDSVWSYHVWGEVWMRRPDLDPRGEYDGWQVVDPTPQERSNGIYTCGPCPVRAVKEGDVRVDDDVGFIFAEVNADRVQWRENQLTETLVECGRSKNFAGKEIITHRPTGRPYRGASIRSYGGPQKLERYDITHTYKYEEGSKKEEVVLQKMERAFQRLSGVNNSDIYNTDYITKGTDDIKIEIEDIGDVFVGRDFQFSVHVKNTGSHMRSVKRLVLKVLYKTYFGAITGQAQGKEFESFQVTPGQSETFIMKMDSTVSWIREKDDLHFHIKAVAEIDDDENPVSEQTSFLLRQPNIRLLGPTSCHVDDDLDVTVTFTNPLPVTLTNCQVDIEGSLSCEHTTQDIFAIPDIPSGSTWKSVLHMKPHPYPRRKQMRDFSIGLESTQLRNIIGYYAVTLTE